MSIIRTHAWATRLREPFWYIAIGPPMAEKCPVDCTAPHPRDPRNSVPLRSIAISYYFEHDYVRALAAARSVASQYPGVPMAIVTSLHHLLSLAASTMPICTARSAEGFPLKFRFLSPDRDRHGSAPRTTNTCSTVCERRAGMAKAMASNAPATTNARRRKLIAVLPHGHGWLFSPDRAG